MYIANGMHDTVGSLSAFPYLFTCNTVDKLEALKYRVFITHTDADGYACAVLDSTLMTKYSTNNVGYASPIFKFTRPGEGICHAIRGAISELSVLPDIRGLSNHYRKGIDTIWVMITDLGSFDPKWMLELMDDGHKVIITIVDHHRIPNLKLQEYVELSRKYTFEYFYDYRFSAASNLYHLMRSHYPEFHTPAIYDWVCAVSDLDTGNWGRWRCDVRDMADGAKEMLHWASYKNKHEWATWWINQFSNGAIHDYGTDPEYLRRVNDQYPILQTEYEQFCDELRPINPSDCSFGFQIPEGLKVVGYTDDKEERKFKFSNFYTKEYLETFKSVDLIVIETGKGIELRSVKESVNCYNIAVMNGGGGHPRASGFPKKLK